MWRSYHAESIDGSVVWLKWMKFVSEICPAYAAAVRGCWKANIFFSAGHLQLMHGFIFFLGLRWTVVKAKSLQGQHKNSVRHIVFLSFCLSLYPWKSIRTVCKRHSNPKGQRQKRKPRSSGGHRKLKGELQRRRWIPAGGSLLHVTPSLSLSDFLSVHSQNKGVYAWKKS